ncbi:hypothetical protein [Glycomyces buryatensis]|uniref:Uncharacterized protein n=1 Tax=Glycomyces buryatensis TaxID=2570927 RepID=A0A4S8QGA6_9ACTN|nr:hypothetical protein [Glycomyces buryatensis]THV42731.1 hypothetical protein FAB82_04920 [Glycomyces buryatensis]
MTAESPRWIVEGERSGRPIIIAPTATSGIDDAVRRMDLAFDGWAGPIPGWFKVLEKIGRWWYLIWVAIGIAVMALVVDREVWEYFVYGPVPGVFVATITGFLAYGLGHLQARISGGLGGRDAVIAALASQVRPGGAVKKMAVAALAADPAAEHYIHDLAWRAAGIGEANRVHATEELTQLWREADPEDAAAFDAKIADIEAKFKKLGDDGKI